MAEEAVGELRGGVSRKLAHVTALLAHTHAAVSRVDEHDVRLHRSVNCSDMYLASVTV